MYNSYYPFKRFPGKDCEYSHKYDRGYHSYYNLGAVPIYKSRNNGPQWRVNVMATKRPHGQT